MQMQTIFSLPVLKCLLAFASWVDENIITRKDAIKLNFLVWGKGKYAI